MKKTKHFNISVPELGDVPDITQVSNAISDLEDATAGTLEIMKAEMQGTKITLTSVSRKTKRTGYYEGMSIRFKSTQDIEPNYLKTISVDGLGDQTLSVEYKVNRNEYIDIVYEENKFTAYPVVVQKTDSVSTNSSILVGTAKGVKTAYDKGVEALNKASQAQSSADKAQSTADGKENAFEKKSGFNLDKTDNAINDTNKLFTAKGAYNLKNEVDTKVSKSGDTMTGDLRLKLSHENDIKSVDILDNEGNDYVKLYANGKYGLVLRNKKSQTGLTISNDGNLYLDAINLRTSSKEVIGAINELVDGKNNLFEMIQGNSGIKFDKNLIFLNDAGEKRKGNVYLDRLQNGMFECIQTTTSTVNSSSYFKNFSNDELSNKLENLSNFVDLRINQALNVSEAQNMTITEFLLKNKKYGCYYLRPEHFTDLKGLPYQDSNWELTLLYVDYSYGAKFIMVCADVSYFGNSWNGSSTCNLYKIGNTANSI